jgi:hypothetical protein
MQKNRKAENDLKFRTVRLLSLVPFFPIIAIGTIFGSSRLAHKVFDTLFEYLNPPQTL